MRVRTPLFAFALVVVPASLVAYIVAKESLAPNERDRSSDGALVVQPGVEGPSTVPVDDYRARQKAPVEQTIGTIRRAVDVIARQDQARVQNADDLKNYLQELESRARKRGRVTALEVEPGMRALQEQLDRVGPEKTASLRADFLTRMTRLSVELSPQDSAPFPAMDELLNQLSDAGDEEQFRQAVDQYLAQVSTLDPEEVHGAMRKLDERVPKLAADPSPPDFVQLEKAVSDASTTAERREAVRAYNAALATLSEDSSMTKRERLGELLR